MSNLGLTPGPPADAFARMIAYLRADFDLARTVQTWQVWTGDRMADVATDAGTKLPIVRLTPTLPAPEAIAFNAGRRLWRQTIEVAVEAAVAGTRWADSAALWAAIVGRLTPADPADLTAAGLPPVDRPTPAVAVNPGDSTFSVARGSFAFDVHYWG